MSPLEHWIERFEAAAHAPWWLNHGTTACLVESGGVDIFVTRMAEDRPIGTRHPLYRVPPRIAIFPARDAVTDNGHALIAVPLPQTRIRSVPLAEMLERATTAADRRALAALIAGWTAVITRGPMPPRDYRALRSHEPLSVEAGHAFSPIEGPLWIKVSEGTCAFMGEPDLEITPDTPPLPLRIEAWARAVSRLTVTATDDVALLDCGELWSGVEAYQTLAIRHAVRAIDRANQDEETRLRMKADQSSRVMHDALARFVRVARGERHMPLELSPDPLLAACEIVGRRLNVSFRSPPQRAQPYIGADRLQEIADASGVRTRTVALKNEWYKHDNGPLLAFDGESRAPYALLPVKTRVYELHDPANGISRPVTPHLAQSLAPFAVQFYRSFESKALKLQDVLAFALRGQSREISSLLAFGLLAGVLGIAIPIATGHMVDSVIPSAQHDDAVALMFALIAAILASQMFEIVRSIAVLRLESKMDGALQAAVWDRVLALPVRFFRDYTAGDLANRITGINLIRHALSGTTVTTVLSSLFSGFNFLLLFYYDVRLALIATGLTLLAVALILASGLLKLRYERELAELAGRLSGTVFQYLVGIVKVRVGAAENRAFANWARQFTALRSVAFKAQKIAVADHTFFSGYQILVNVLIFTGIGIFLLEGSDTGITTGEFVAFNAAFGAFFAALIVLSETLLGLLGLVPVYARARPIMETLPEVDRGKKHPGELQGSIDVVKLGFAYKRDQPILTDVTFNVRPGGFIALVGASGSGKSTLFRLLLGFEKPTRGSIYYDNQDLADLDLRALRRQLGVVLQGGQLTSGDIFTNIVGSSSLTIDDAWEAARMVGLDEDVKAMPMGMHTVVAEGSSTLSGGQRQRILIARAIVNRPRILLFDEATSALDNRTQAIVARSLEQLKATRIVIAHRLSTVMNADRIIVLQGGMIVQAGNYDELIGQSGPFADLAKRQIA